MTRPDLLSVDEALAAMLGEVMPIEETETVDLHHAGGRILARDLAALRTQPPFPASAMDGYAVRAADLESEPRSLRVIGESAAGHGFDGTVEPGTCVRIFTGAPLPDGADTIAIQENARTFDDGTVSFMQSERKGRFVRPVGLDFRERDVLLRAGRRLEASSIALAAAMGHPSLTVRRAPRAAVLATGDELVEPGGNAARDCIVASNGYGVGAIARATGADVTDLGIAPDETGAIMERIAIGESCDIVVTLGGASVGDHDLVKDCLAMRGVSMRFLKIAMKPGKPVMFGHRDVDGHRVLYLALPGNPVSGLVTGRVLLRPLLLALQGLPTSERTVKARLSKGLAASGDRREYMRAVHNAAAGTVFAHETQDSSQLSVLAASNALLVRPPNRPATPIGAEVDLLSWE